MKNIVRKVIPINNGIFSHIDYAFLDFQSSELDMLFIARFGMRQVAPSVWILQDGPGDVLTQEDLAQLGNLILKMYKVKWDKISRLIDLEYDPIHNFSDVTTEEIEDSASEVNGTTSSRSDVLTASQTLTNNLENRVTNNLVEQVDTTNNDSSIRTNNLSEIRSKEITSAVIRTDALNRVIDHTETNNLSEGNQDNVFGFNSEVAVGDRNGTRDSSENNTFTESVADTGTQKTDTTGSDSENTTNTGTVENSSSSSGSSTKENTGTKISADTGTVVTSKSDALTRASEENAEKQNNYTRSRKLSRDGNIGNITTQQLMAEEIDLWRWNFIEEVLNDVKDFLTIPVYD